MRQMWWKCQVGHVGSFLGVVCVTEKKKQKIMKDVVRIHRKKHGCSSAVFTVAATRESLDVEMRGRLVFRVSEREGLVGKIV